MDKSLPAVFRQAMYNLRGGFLIRPLTITLVLGCAGALFSWLEEAMPEVSDVVPRALFPSHSDPQVAQAILGDIAASIMTVVSIVFAILLMTLTLASMQFSPRIIVSFVQDRVTQWTLGIFLGTFSYCMTALPTARSLPKPFAPVATTTGAMLLALICVGWLLFFIYHISQSISVSHIVDRIAAETETIIDEMMPWPHNTSGQAEAATVDFSTWDMPLGSQASGYIRFIDTKKLLSLASDFKVKVRVLRRVGQFVPEGAPVFMIYKADRLTEQDRMELLSVLELGPSRTLQQDLEFGVLQIVDIALKAISPAVNDPSTGVTCVDQLSRIMIRFAAREPAVSVLYDPGSVARVSIPWIHFERLLEAAFEQIRLYSTGDMAVSLRMLRALGDIAGSTTDPAYRRTLYEEGKRILEGCTGKLGPVEVEPMHARLAAIEKLSDQAAGVL